MSTVGIPAGPLGDLHRRTPARTPRRFRCTWPPPDKRKRSDVQIVAALRPKFAGRVPGHRLPTSTWAGSSTASSTAARRTRSRSRCWATTSRTRQAAGREVARVMRDVPGVADVQVSREGNYPQFSVVVDREKAATAGLSQRDVAQAALFSLNSNVSVNPSIFTDPRTGNQYNIVVQLDEPFRVQPEDLGKIFVTPRGGRPVVAVHHRRDPAERGAGGDRAQVPAAARSGSPANPVGRDLGAISDEIERRSARAPAAGRLLGADGRPDGAAAGGVRQPDLHEYPGADARLHGHGLAVPVAEGPLHHHVLGADGAHRRHPGAVPDPTRRSRRPRSWGSS